ncbi:glycosyltransferase family 2 protein [Methanococcoides burtonii]|uniref:Glycosyl transferase, family 2 n=1 Tax=Methanococcoides burtonii (strain DSM 6242 / NBRC 107633 / OCM 468 / ACE-M) TaxID=259564 RepID=Q12VL5_METBU|nr:glycosyltransferase [Methanococcoides burtonii]ABE52511.1 glycosyl transferase, family 2 [Methanococcoides burtonii DSM 6242]
MVLPNTIDSPTISIIMNCFNCSKYLKEAIDSVYAQTYEDWEIIFWDNVSTDNSAEIANSYDNKLRYFCGNKNVPLGYARNLAIEKIQGKYIAFLDCDDMWLPTKLEKQMAIFESTSNVKLVFSDCNIVDSQHNIINRSFAVQTPARGNVFEKLLMSYNFIPLVTAMIEKDVLDDVGCFDNTYRIAEEYDMFLRIAYKYPIDFVDEPLAEYRVHDSNCSHRQDIGIKEELMIMDHWKNTATHIEKKISIQLKKKILKRKAALYVYYIVSKLKLPKRFSKYY